METEIQEGQEQLRRENTDALENPSSLHGSSLGAGSKTKSPISTKQDERNLNRGMSKKERRRVEALEHKLEPRIQKLEEQLRAQKDALALDDALRGKESHASGSTGDATSTEDGEHEGGDQEDQVIKTADVKGEEKEETTIGKLIGALQTAGLGDDPTALRLLADLAALEPLRRETTDALENGKQGAHSPLASKGRASHVIQPSGGGIPPAPDLRAEYEKRVNELRPGDIDGLMEVKREFRRKGMEVW